MADIELNNEGNYELLFHDLDGEKPRNLLRFKEFHISPSELGDAWKRICKNYIFIGENRFLMDGVFVELYNLGVGESAIRIVAGEESSARAFGVDLGLPCKVV